MSGEHRHGIFQGNKYAVADVGGTNYQLNQAEFKTIYLKNIADKVMTQKQLEKAIEKGHNQVSDYSQKHDKYTIYQLAVGIVSFGKYKPVFEKNFNLNKGSYRAKKDEELYGYVIYDSKGQEVSYKAYPTVAKAKSVAIELLKQNYNRDGRYFIKKVYRSVFGATRKTITMGWVRLEKVGEMKSRPKKEPKSFVVLPIYQYVYDGCLVDYEYEYN